MSKYYLIDKKILIVTAVFMLMALLSLDVLGAEKAIRPGMPAPSETEFLTAPVEIDGQKLFRVRGVSSFPAAQRAVAIRERIEAVAADPAIGGDALRVDDVDDTSTIMAGDQPLMVVTEGDARLERAGRRNVATAHLNRIRQAIDDYRRMRSREALLRGGLYAVGATVVLAVAIILLLWMGRWLDRVLTERVQKRIHSFGIQSFEFVRAEQIWRMLQGILYAVRVIVILAVVVAYLHFTFALFPWTRGYAFRLFDIVAGPLGIIGKAAVARIPDLLILAVIFFIFRFALRLLRLFFDAISQETVKLAEFDAAWALPTYKIIRFAVIAFGVIVAYPYIPGSQSAAFKGISLFVGVVFSIGSSSAISNIIAGYMLTYRRAFKVGDRVKIGDVVGDVSTMRLQVTHLRSLKNEEVVIPNSQILNGHVVNYSTLAHTEGLILHTIVGIGYETPWRQVEAMLLLAAERTQGLLSEPRAFILQKGLGDFAVNYELNVYCDNAFEMNELYTELHRQILDVFNEYAVQIMTPAYRADTPEPKVVPREMWHAPPAAPELKEETVSK